MNNLLTVLAIVIFWVKYIYYVIIGKRPLLYLQDGLTYDIHPSAVRGLWVGLTTIEFSCSMNGYPVFISILHDKVIGLGVEDERD